MTLYMRYIAYTINVLRTFDSDLNKHIGCRGCLLRRRCAPRSMPTVLCSRASWAGVVSSNWPDAVIWEFGIGGCPLTSGISEVHVSAKCTWKYPDQCYGDRVIHALGLHLLKTDNLAIYANCRELLYRTRYLSLLIIICWRFKKRRTIVLTLNRHRLKWTIAGYPQPSHYHSSARYVCYMLIYRIRTMKVNWQLYTSM